MYTYILWDANDGMFVGNPLHAWGVTGCDDTMLDSCLASIERNSPGALVSFFADEYDMVAHLAETGRSY